MINSIRENIKSPSTTTRDMILSTVWQGSTGNTSKIEDVKKVDGYGLLFKNRIGLRLHVNQGKCYVQVYIAHPFDLKIEDIDKLFNRHYTIKGKGNDVFLCQIERYDGINNDNTKVSEIKYYYIEINGDDVEYDDLKCEIHYLYNLLFQKS